jgi:hypothetical protein
VKICVIWWLIIFGITINYAIVMVFERDTGIGVSTAQHPYSFGYIMAGN